VRTLFCDIESHYEMGGYSLSKMTTQEYALDERFELICMVVHDESTGETHTAHGAQLAPLLDWMRSIQDETIFTSFNAKFDAACLDWRFNYRPALLACPMSMARALGLSLVSGLSLDALTKLGIAAGRQWPNKGTEVVYASGKRAKDFSPADMRRYIEYCRIDTLLCRELFYEFLPLLPEGEMVWHSLILQAFTHRNLGVDRGLVEEELVRVKAKRVAAMERLCAALGVADVELLRTVLSSNSKMVEALHLFGAKAPTKISKATGKRAPALGKGDPEFLAMLDHPIPEVAALVAARLDLKSSIEVSRCEGFLKLADLGPLPVPYKIAGAHTSRLSGEEGTNFQNLPSGRKDGQSNSLRRSIVAKPGHALVGCDASQQEVRLSFYIAGSDRVMDDFRNGVCPYARQAADLFGGDPAEIKRLAKAGIEPHAKQRVIGKSARLGLGFGAGAETFVTYVKVTAGLDLTLDESDVYVRGYRTGNPEVTRAWRMCNRVLKVLVAGGRVEFGGMDGKLFLADGARRVLGQHMPGIRLPDGIWLSYPGLRIQAGEWEDGSPKEEFVFDVKKGRTVVQEHTYAAKIFENCTQALGAACIKWYAALLTYPLVLTTHDELVVIAPEAEAEKAKAEILEVMSMTPPWLPGCPFTAEAGVARRYGDT
jgi:DNA polymerase family A